MDAEERTLQIVAEAIDRSRSRMAMRRAQVACAAESHDWAVNAISAGYAEVCLVCGVTRIEVEMFKRERDMLCPVVKP